MPQHKDDGVTPELRATRIADPAAELRKAIKKHDLRFLGVAGVTITVPSAPGGRWSPLVQIRGIHVIEGTSDAIESDEHGRLQQFAHKYAERYNRLLVAHLLRVNDMAVVHARHKIDQELTRIERSDPIRDAEKVGKQASLLDLINLPGDTDSVQGIDPKLLKAAQASGSYGFSMWSFIFVPEVMTPVQRRRFDRQISRYIVPYNRYVFDAYQTRKKASR